MYRQCMFSRVAVALILDKALPSTVVTEMRSIDAASSTPVIRHYIECMRQRIRWWSHDSPGVIIRGVSSAAALLQHCRRGRRAINYSSSTALHGVERKGLVTCLLCLTSRSCENHNRSQFGSSPDQPLETPPPCSAAQAAPRQPVVAHARRAAAAFGCHSAVGCWRVSQGCERTNSKHIIVSLHPW